MPPVNEQRLRTVNGAPVRHDGEYVLYWCQMSRRLTHNHSLDFAIERARELKKPLVIYEGLKLNYPWACARFHAFLLEGMQYNAAVSKQMHFNYWPFVETPEQAGRGLVRKLAAKACLVVTDDYPAFIVPAQTRALAAKVDAAVVAVDSNSVVPLSLLGKRVSAAAHLRPRIHKLFPEHWPQRAYSKPSLPKSLHVEMDAPFEIWQPPEDLAAFVSTLPIDHSVPPLEDIEGGTAAGRKQLQLFIRQKLPRYVTQRNGPDAPEVSAASGISPWLHYGHISIEEVVEAALNTQPGWSIDELNRLTRNKDDYYCRDSNINGFLDEAVTWRDVGYHWHYTRNLEAEGKTRSWQTLDRPAFNFQSMDFTPSKQSTLEQVLPDWAKATLAKHAADRREFNYTLEEFESARTHDELWNAAQTELVHTGKIHNYLRMLWAKKVLEWSASPDDAYAILEHLNNKYAIDGRDPNSYTGILWCFGLFDRPWAPERDIFGSVRFMSSANTARKFKLTGYYDYIAALHGKPAAGKLF